MSLASQHQPPPNITDDTPVIEVVMADLKERAEVGKVRYGTYLQPHNGRDAMWDAFQEALDLCMYLRQVIIERDAHP